MTRVLRHLAAIAALLVCSSSWAAAVFTSSSAFLAQVAPGAYTENFTSVVDANTNVQVFSGPGGFGYTASVPSGQQFYFGAGSLSTNLPSIVVTLTFTGTAVTAIGGNFYAIDVADAFLGRRKGGCDQRVDSEQVHEPGRHGLIRVDGDGPPESNPVGAIRIDGRTGDDPLKTSDPGSAPDGTADRPANDGQR